MYGQRLDQGIVRFVMLLHRDEKSVKCYAAVFSPIRAPMPRNSKRDV